MKSSIKGDPRYSAVDSKHLRERFFKEYVSQQEVGTRNLTYYTHFLIRKKFIRK